MALSAIHAVLDFLLEGIKGRRRAAEVLVSAGMMNNGHSRSRSGTRGGIKGAGGEAPLFAGLPLNVGLPLSLSIPSGASAGRPLAFIYEGEEELEGAAG